MQAPAYNLHVEGGNNGRGGFIIFEGDPADFQQLLQPPRSCLVWVQCAALLHPSLVCLIDAEAAAAAKALKAGRVAAARAAGLAAATRPPALNPAADALGPTPASQLLAALRAALAADVAGCKVGKARKLRGSVLVCCWLCGLDIH
jgi:hypothetical protein